MWFVYFTVVMIALVATTYSVEEGEAISVCAAVVGGAIGRDVSIMFSTARNSATGELIFTQNNFILITFMYASTVIILLWYYFRHC